MIRVFIAADLPARIRDGCRRIADELRGLGLEGRFVRHRSMHLTLKFLGEIEQSRVEPLAESLRSLARGFSPFQIGIAGVGVFPGLNRPRVVWVGVEPHHELKTLQQRVEEEMEGLGFPREERDFQPHLTLLRLKSRRNVEELARYMAGRGAGRNLGRVPVSELCLYQSLLKPSGAEYRQLAGAVLGG